MTKVVTMNVHAEDVTLAAAFKHYIAATNCELTPEEYASVQAIFYAGASTILSTFDVLTAKALDADNALQDAIDQGLPSATVEQLDAVAEDFSVALALTMSRLMQEVYDSMGLENTSKLKDAVPSLVPDQKQVGSGLDFDLTTWNPKGPKQ